MDKDDAIFRTNLLNQLRSGPTVVTFTKKDLTTRVMECTLKADMLPPLVETKLPEDGDGSPKVARKKNENQCVVYDLANKAWRSFTYDSVREYRAKEVA